MFAGPDDAALSDLAQLPDHRQTRTRQGLGTGAAAPGALQVACCWLCCVRSICAKVAIPSHLILQYSGQAVTKRVMSKVPPYQLSMQVGFNLRRANQRHVAIFSQCVTLVTPTQFAALARLFELGGLSQNKLGRMTAMDSATIKGVVERLKSKGLVDSRADINDQRLSIVELTPKGRRTYLEAQEQALRARADTLEPLNDDEIRQFEALLEKLI